MSKFECPDCQYIYDEDRGEPHEGYEPGTLWEQVPDSFPCPNCFVREKPDFLAVTEKIE